MVFEWFHRQVKRTLWPENTTHSKFLPPSLIHYITKKTWYAKGIQIQHNIANKSSSKDDTEKHYWNQYHSLAKKQGQQTLILHEKVKSLSLELNDQQRMTGDDRRTQGLLETGEWSSLSWPLE